MNKKIKRYLRFSAKSQTANCTIYTTNSVRSLFPLSFVSLRYEIILERAGRRSVSCEAVAGARGLRAQPAVGALAHVFVPDLIQGASREVGGQQLVHPSLAASTPRACDSLTQLYAMQLVQRGGVYTSHGVEVQILRVCGSGSGGEGRVHEEHCVTLLHTTECSEALCWIRLAVHIARETYCMQSNRYIHLKNLQYTVRPYSM